MAISDAQKVDYLLKKIGYGISKTDTSTNKSPANESVASPLLIRGDGLYAQSDLISVVGTLPASNSSVVTVYRDSLSSAVQTTNDGTAATNRTWKTNLTDWIGPEFGSGYAVKVYTGASLTAATASSSGTALAVDGSGNNDSWFFDYQSGVLNFADTNVPSSIAAQVWVVGARYTGQKGITSLLSASTTGTANVSLYDNVTAYTTNQIFFPQFSNISTTGNTQTGVNSSFGFNPSTGTLSTTIVNAAHNGSIGATTPNTAVFTTATTGGLQAVALGNVTPGTYVFTTGSVGGLQAVAIGNVTAGTGAFTTLTASTWANITGATQSTSSSTGALVVTGGAGIGANLYVGGNTTISGNLTVIGTTTTVQSTTLDVSDLNITVAKGAVSAAAANGAGLTVDGAGATILYTNATDTWNFNKGLVGTTITTGGLQAQAIGNVTPGTYVFTTGSVGGLQAVAIGNATPGSGAFTTGTFSSTLGVTGATTMTTATTGGLQAVAIGNATPGTGVFTTGTFNTATTGGLQAVAIGNVTPGSGAFTTGTFSSTLGVTGATTLTTATTGGLQAQAIGNVTPGTGVFTTGTFNTATTGGLQAVAIGNVTPGTGVFTTTSTGGLQAVEIGNVTPGSGVFTTTSTGGLQAVAIGNVTPGTGVFVSVQSQAIGNVIPGTAVFTTTSTGGLQAVAIGNVTPGTGAFTTGTFSSTLGVTGATTMTTATTGGLQAVAIGNVTPGTGVFTTGTFNTATTGGLQAVAIGNVTAGTGAFTTLSASTWANITGTTAATSTTTGALVVAGGAGIAGALHVGSTATITGNTAVNNTLYGRGVYDNGVQVVSTSTGAGNLTISTGGINLTPVGPGAVTTGDSVSIPVITTDAYGRITSISTAAVTSVAGAANVSFHTQTVALNNNATFFPTFSNINGGNSIPGTSSLLTYNASTGNLVSQLGFVSSSQASTSTTSGALQVAGGAGIGGNVHVGGSISATNEITSTKNEEATSTTTGAIRATGGIATQANLFVGKAATFNSSQTAGMDFVVRGKTDTTLIWARPSASYDTVIIGNSAVAGNVVAGAKLNINTTDSILIPVGTNAQRPGNQGQTDVQGMFRYSTTQNAIEWYTGTQWNAASTQFTVITDEQFTGDGSTVAFTMGAAATTASTIVSINGVLQIPTLAYSCSSTTLTFTEAPASSDIIDVRRLTTTTSVTHIDDATGYNAIDVDNTDGVTISTGTAAKNNRYRINTDGAQVSLLANTAVASANTATTIDTMSTTVYRSAKYTIQATNGADYQVLEALLISNGTTATVIAYGTIQTAGNLGIISATQSGSNALLQFVALNASTNVRITKEYLLI